MLIKLSIIQILITEYDSKAKQEREQPLDVRSVRNEQERTSKLSVVCIGGASVSSRNCATSKTKHKTDRLSKTLAVNYLIEERSVVLRLQDR